MGFETDRDHVGDEDAVVAALVELHRRKQRARRPGGKGSSYARVLEHFERRGKRLRGERLVTEELLGRLVASARALPPASAQQELEITGPMGGTAAGRFRVTNRSSEPARVDFAIGDPLDGDWRPTLTFEPARPELPPGGACLVRVAADLGGVSAPAACVLPVECRSSGRRDRLWLSISAFDRDGGER